MRKHRRFMVAPASRADAFLAGPDNDFDSLDAACEAARSLDKTMPLDLDGSDDEWCVYEEVNGGWKNITR